MNHLPRIVFLTCISVAIGLAQSTVKPPVIEVATVKPHPFTPERSNVGLRITGSIVTVGNYTIRNLVYLAYGATSFQLEGGPAWFYDSGADWYDIAVKLEGDATPTREQAISVLQTVLEDRFQLKVRRDVRETPSYGLVVAKSGPKPKLSDPDARFRSDTSSGLMTATKMTMSQLARTLSSRIDDKPVVDKTGLTGEYDIRLEAAEVGFQPPDPAQIAASNRPSLFVALEEQLGLRLVSEKNPIEYLVIEHVEKPSPN